MARVKRSPRGRRQRSAKSRPFPKPNPVTDRRIIAIDDTPLRKRAATECKRAMAKLEKARGVLRHFETDDRPAFNRWLAGTFGALLTELRENSRRINEQEDLIDEVEMEMMWGENQNPRKAYAVVMKRRENPEPEDDFDPRAAEDFSGEGPSKDQQGASTAHEDEGGGFRPFADAERIPEEERRAMFEDFLQIVLGLHSEQMSKAEYERLFARLDADMFGGAAKGNPFVIHEEDARPGDANGGGRIKEIYRILVRRLHPDLRADGDAQVSAMWHDVQEAYEARDLDRLETLLALTEMAEGGTGRQATFGQMQGALKELKRALRAIQRAIRTAKRNPAWAFTQREDRTSLEKSIRREMEADIAGQRRALALIKRTLDDWSRPWIPRKRKSGKQPSKPATKTPVSKTPFTNPLQPDLFTF